MSDDSEYPISRLRFKNAFKVLLCLPNKDKFGLLCQSKLVNHENARYELKLKFRVMSESNGFFIKRTSHQDM